MVRGHTGVRCRGGALARVALNRAAIEAAPNLDLKTAAASFEYKRVRSGTVPMGHLEKKGVEPVCIEESSPDQPPKTQELDSLL